MSFFSLLLTSFCTLNSSKIKTSTPSVAGLQVGGVKLELGTGAELVISGGLLLTAQSSQILLHWSSLQPTSLPRSWLIGGGMRVSGLSESGEGLLQGSSVLGAAKCVGGKGAGQLCPTWSGEEPAFAVFLCLYSENVLQGSP